MSTQTALKPCGTHAAKMRHYRKNETCDTCFPKRKTAECGTTGGYRLHQRRNEPACQPCKNARRDYERAGTEPRPLQPCGTFAALKRHRRNGEKPCQACIEAERAYATERRRKRGIQEATNSAPLIEEIEFLLACGEGEHRILQATGLTRNNLSQRLHRNGRNDLYKAIFEPTPGWVGN